jgi:G6PDH family F420-dependent oxidoreductase
MDTPSVRKTSRYRLHPTPEQEQALETVLETVLWRCRTLSNVALEERKTAWERCGVSVNYSQQADELPSLKAACPEYGEVHSQVLPDVLRRLEKTSHDFFRRLREGEKPGHPRYQGRNRSHSFTYPQYGNGGNGAVLDGGVLSLSKLGRIPIRLHRPLEATPKTVTSSREADGWYACISCAEVPTQPLPLTDQETGIDVGLKAFLVTADGMFVENPRSHRKADRSLTTCQKRVARRQKGSQRRASAVKLLGKAYQPVRRQRRDVHHKTALSLVRQYGTIYREDLQVQNMTRRPAPQPDGNGGDLQNGARAKAGLNTSIHDAGWYSCRLILACKAAWSGKRAVAVPPAFTSQEGSGCGALVQKSLSVRPHVCTSCGLIVWPHRVASSCGLIVWPHPGPRGERGHQHATGRAGPSGSSRSGEGRALRGPRLQPWGACHLGLGTGEALNEYAVTGRWPGYVVHQARLAEATQLMRTLWTGEPVTHRGAYYTTCGAKLYTRPATPPPIYISSLVAESAAFAGRHGDGLITVGGEAPALYRDMLRRFEGSARQAGKDPARMPKMIELTVAYTSDRQRAIEAQRQYWAGALVPALYDQKIYTPAMSAKNGKVVGDDTIAQKVFISADPEAHANFAQPYLELGFDQLIFHSPGPDQRAFIQGYGRDVLPMLRQRSATGGEAMRAGTGQR